MSKICLGGVEMTLKGAVTRVYYLIKYGSCVDPVTKYRKNGVKIGENVKLYNAHIDRNHGYLITIGNNVTITNACILSHDASTHIFTGYSKINTVNIGDNVFIGYGAIVLPGVDIGNNCIIGAGSVVTKDVPDNSVYAGNPAHFICSTSDYIEKHKALMTSKPVFDKTWELSDEEKASAKKKVISSDGGYDL